MNRIVPNTPAGRASGAGDPSEGRSGGRPGGRPGGRSSGWLSSSDAGAETGLRALTYLMLLLFGALQGLLGCFFYAVGPSPLAALLFDALILATCVFGGWGLRRASGGLAPAAGWLVVVFVLASGTPGGSVVITASSAGEWFLFGGAISATAGVIAAFTLWSRAGLARSRDPR